MYIYIYIYIYIHLYIHIYIYTYIYISSFNLLSILGIKIFNYLYYRCVPINTNVMLNVTTDTRWSSIGVVTNISTQFATTCSSYHISGSYTIKSVSFIII